MRRGEVRWYEFRPPDKRRPVLILTRDSVLDVLGDVTIAPNTRTVRSISSEVLLTEADGMPETCAVNLDHVQTVPRAKVGALITELKPEKMDQVRAALSFALGFKSVWPPWQPGSVGRRLPHAWRSVLSGGRR